MTILRRCIKPDFAFGDRVSRYKAAVTGTVAATLLTYGPARQQFIF